MPKTLRIFFAPLRTSSFLLSPSPFSIDHGVWGNSLSGHSCANSLTLSCPFSVFVRENSAQRPRRPALGRLELREPGASQPRLPGPRRKPRRKPRPSGASETKSALVRCRLQGSELCVRAPSKACLKGTERTPEDFFAARAGIPQRLVELSAPASLPRVKQELQLQGSERKPWQHTHVLCLRHAGSKVQNNDTAVMAQIRSVCAPRVCNPR